MKQGKRITAMMGGYSQRSLHDVLPEELETRKNQFYETLVNVSAERAHEIEKSTQTQAADPDGLWQKGRRIRVTSSTAGKIAKGRAGHEAGKVKDLLYLSFRGSNATRWGQQQESNVRDAYVALMHSTGHKELKTIKTGLVVSGKNPWLAASSDDRVHDPLATDPHGLAEYKNPWGARNISIREAASTISHFCVGLTNDTLHLKHSHDYYYQVQIAMYCDQRQWCDFVVKTEVDILC